MKTVTRSLLLSYSPISSDQLVELYCRRLEVVVAIYSRLTKVFLCRRLPNKKKIVAVIPYLV